MYKDAAKRMLAWVLVCCMICGMPDFSLLAKEAAMESVTENTGSEPEGKQENREILGETEEPEGKEDGVQPFADGGLEVIAEDTQTPEGGAPTESVSGIIVDAEGNPLSDEGRSLPIGETLTVRCVEEGNPANEISDIVWESSNAAAVSVENGVVTARAKDANWITISATKTEGSEKVTVASAKVTACASLSSNITVEGTTTEGGKIKLTNPVSYTGSAVEPSIRLKEGETSIPSSSYTVRYENNTAITKDGAAKAVITGNGGPNGYLGTLEVYFDIKVPFDLLTYPSALGNQTGTGLKKQPKPEVAGLAITDDKRADGTQQALQQLENAASNEDGYAVAVDMAEDEQSAVITVTLSGIYFGEKTYTVKVANDISVYDVVLSYNGDESRSWTYEGKEIKPTVKVKVNDTVELSSDNYDVEYVNCTDAGSASVIITGKGAYGGSKTETFIIGVADVSQIFEVEATVPAIYNKGKAKSGGVPPASLQITNVKTNAPADEKDYAISYEGADKFTETSTAKVTVTGNGNCSGSVSKTYKINKASLAEGAYQGDNEIQAEIVDADKLHYKGEGKQIIPTVKVTQGGAELENGVDYTLEYGENVNAGTKAGSVTIKAKDGGNYTGERTVKFDIKKFDLTVFPIDKIPAIPEQEYTGSALKPNEDSYKTLTIAEQDVHLERDKDYTVEYTKNTDVGNAVVRFIGMGDNCTGQTVTNFTIYKNLSHADIVIADIPDQTYTGQPIKPEPEVKDKETVIEKNENAALSKPAYSSITYNPENPVNVGTYTLTVTGDGKYYRGSKDTTFKIKARTMDTLQAQFADPVENNQYVFTGSPIHPAVKILDTENNIEMPTSDFLVEWLSASNQEETGALGSYSVRVSPIDPNNYSGGNLTLTYEIIKRSFVPDDAEFEVTIKDPQNLIYSGSEIYPELIVTDKKRIQNGAPYVLVKNTDYTAEYANNVNAGQDTASVTITGINNYTGSITKKFTILQMDLSAAGNVSIELTPDTEYFYTGKNIVPSVQKITVDGKELSSANYELVSEAKNKGTGNVFTIKGKGNYKGSIVSNASCVQPPVTFEIKAKPISDADIIVEDIPNQPMVDGQTEVRPKVTIKYGDVLLLETTDYTLSYRNNTAIDNDNTPEEQLPTVIITANPDGNFTGERTKTFHIRSSISQAVIGKLNREKYTYSISACEPKPESVTLEGVTLTEGVDYEVKYRNNINAWVASRKDDPALKPTVVIEGIGQYGGSAEKTFDISQVEVRSAPNGLQVPLTLTINGATSKPFTGSKTYPEFTIKYSANNPNTGEGQDAYILKEGVDFEITSAGINASNNNALQIRPMGNFHNSVFVNLKTYTITPKPLTSYDIQFTPIDPVDFNNQVVTPAVELFDYKRNPDGSYNPEGVSDSAKAYKLVAGSDYNTPIVYRDNAKPGTATITIKGKGNYSGSKDIKFTIKGSLESTSIVFKNKTGAGEADYKYTGSEIKPVFDLKITAGTKETILKSGTDYTYQIIGDPINVGAYTIEITGIGSYEGTAITRTFNIVKRNLSDPKDVTINMAESVNYTGEDVWPEVTIKCGAYTLVENEDYVLIPERPCTVPTVASHKKYRLLIQAGSSGNFEGEITKSYTIGINLDAENCGKC